MFVNFDGLEAYFVALILPTIGTINYELGLAAEYVWTWPGWFLLLAGFLGSSLIKTWLINCSFINPIYFNVGSKLKQNYFSLRDTFLSR